MSDLARQLKPFVERYLKEEIEMDAQLFSAGAWNAIVEQYVTSLDTVQFQKALVKLIKLPSEIAYIGVKDLLTKLNASDENLNADQYEDNVTQHPQSSFDHLPEKQSNNIDSEFSEEEELDSLHLPPIERFELRSGEDISELELPTSVQQPAADSSLTPVTGMYLPANKSSSDFYGSTDLEDDDSNALFDEMSDGNALLTSPMSEAETRQLEEFLSENKSFLGKYTNFPANVQAHPYLVLRLPMFTASKQSYRKTDISAEPVGQEYLRKIELQNHDGFNKVSIEGPSMNSTHFFVWDCLIRVFRDQASSGLVEQRGVARVKITDFLSYYGLPAKRKNHRVKMMIKNCLNDLSKQKLIISGGDGKHKGFDYAKEASLTLIKEYLFDEEKDIMTVSAGSSFFNLFRNYHLIPTDVELIKSFSSEIERIALIHLTGLPTNTTKIVRLDTIIHRVKPNEKTLNSRELNSLKNLFLRLRDMNKVSFDLDETGKYPAYRNFKHSLQRPKRLPLGEIKPSGPELKWLRKPRLKPTDEESYQRSLIDWALKSSNSVRAYLQESDDELLTCLSLAKIEILIEAGEITGDSTFQKDMQSIIDKRRTAKPWLTKRD